MGVNMEDRCEDIKEDTEHKMKKQVNEAKYGNKSFIRFACSHAYTSRSRS